MNGEQRHPSYDRTSMESSSHLTHEVDANATLQLSSHEHQLTKATQGENGHSGSNNSSNSCIQSAKSKTWNDVTSNDDFPSSEFWLETRLFLELAGTSTVLNLGPMISLLLTASHIGRKFDPVYLSAFTLATLTGNLSTLSVMAGLFSVSDTLSPQAYGRGDFAEVGRIAIRGYVVAAAALFPVNEVLVGHLGRILVALGQDEAASTYASQWYTMFALSLPFSILFNCLWKFLMAQHVIKPLILVSALSTGVILPLCLEICIRSMGFLGSALAYFIYQSSQALLLLSYVYQTQPHDTRTWPFPTLSPTTVTDALRWNPTIAHLRLGIGGILSQAEWIFWEAIGLVVGRLGVMSLSVYTIPYTTIMTLWMMPCSFGNALAIRMGISMSVSVGRTRRIVWSVVVSSLVVFGVVSGGVYVGEGVIVGAFTNNEGVEELAAGIWPKVALLNMTIAVFGMLVGVAIGLGRQWVLGVINFGVLWMFGLPIIYDTAVVREGGLDAVWFWLNVFYFCINVALIGGLFVFTDWYCVREEMLLSGGKENVDSELDKDERGGIAVVHETTLLL